MRSAIHALYGLELSVMLRRARQDAGLLAAVGVLIATAMFLALAGPQLVLGAVDRGVRDIFVAVGDRSDVRLITAVGSSGSSAGSLVKVVPPEAALKIAEAMPDSLPETLRQSFAQVTVTVVSLDTRMRTDSGAETRVRIAMLTPDVLSGSRLVEGRLPGEPQGEAEDPPIGEEQDPPIGEAEDPPIEVVISQATAKTAGLSVGDVIDVATGINTQLGQSTPSTELLVVGIAEPRSDEGTGAPTWIDLAEYWQPVHREPSATDSGFTRFAVLAAPAGITEATTRLHGPFEASIRVSLKPDAATAAHAIDLVDELRALQSRGSTVAAGTGAAISVRTGLVDALAGYPLKARAALAQMSVMLAGMIGVAAVVVTLLSRLLVSRREQSLVLERARGASVAALSARALAETAGVTLGASMIASLAAGLVFGFAVRDWLPVTVVLLFALLAVPCQVLLLTRAALTGRREPANRRDRARLATRRRAVRIVAEAALVVLAISALVSLRGRGLLQTRADGVDPLLAAAPVLLAASVTLIVVRCYPLVVRVIAAFGRRTRGVLGLLGAVRAKRGISALPLLALTLGIAMASAGGLLVDTVRSGQVDASWQRVGAEARIDAALTTAEVAALRAEPGVEAVGVIHAKGSVDFELGTTSEDVTVVAIDKGYADVVESLPPTMADEPQQTAEAPQQIGAPEQAAGAVGFDPTGLRELAVHVAADDALPVIVSEDLGARLLSHKAAMYFGPRYLELRVIGTTGHRLDGFAEGPYVFVDFDSLSEQLPMPLEATSVFLTGAGAQTAAENASPSAQAALTRSGWIDDRRSLALVAGVESVTVFAVGAVGLLAVVALIASVLGGARERGRSLSMLRTLGMRSRLGWWLALAELAPVVIAAVVGGLAAGVTTVLAIAPALGLDVLSGGLAIPETRLEPLVFARLAIASAVLVIVAALVEVLAHRRDRLSDVLRVGETV